MDMNTVMGVELYILQCVRKEVCLINMYMCILDMFCVILFLSLFLLWRNSEILFILFVANFMCHSLTVFGQVTCNHPTN